MRRARVVPENALTGQMYKANNLDLSVKVSAEEGRLRLWRNTSVATLPAGGSATLAPHTVGYESDEDIDNGERPPGTVRLSTTIGAVDEYLQDYGNVVVPGQTTHHLTMYRAPSGAQVFGAGSVQWTWGLDDTHDSPFAPQPADVRMQQAQVNLFADMGVQPATLQGNLVAASASSDTTGPTVAITSPAAGAATPNGSKVTLTGTATDIGGRVAGVEVSTDGGSSWHPAVGTANWSYSYYQRGNGSQTVKVRSIDDSVNIGSSVNRNLAVSCPCSVFGQELPLGRRCDRYLCDRARSAVHPDGRRVCHGGALLQELHQRRHPHGHPSGPPSGARLATVVFTGESASGWQQATFDAPVALSAGASYTVSYTAPQGRYSYQLGAFYERGVDADPLLVEGGFGSAEAGVFGTAGQFPSGSYKRSNYFVDVSYTTSDSSPLIATNHWPLPNASSVPATTKISAKYSKPPAAGTWGVTVRDPVGDSVAGSTAYDAATRTITFTPARCPGRVREVHRDAARH